MKTPIIALTILFSATAYAQVEIRVPRLQYKAQDKINVEIVNAGATDVSFGVQYGYVSFIDPEHTESTPTPVVRTLGVFCSRSRSRLGNRKPTHFD